MSAYEELAEGIDLMREHIRAMVAALVADGFTDAQARELVVAIFTRKPGDSDE